MSRNSETFRPPSLAQHFDAPEDYTGHFGWLCGYSADALFLDDAAERFTRLTRSQRAHQGRIALAVLLDPGNPPIPLQDSPGVAHLPIIDHAKKPFRLLHAKVALLGFRQQENHSQWQLRLLVSTGNWTRQTLEESLDLVWRIDIASESLSHPDTEIQQDCADIKSAWSLLAWIQQLFDTRLLNVSANGHLSDTMIAQQQVSRWIAVCLKKAIGKPRAFDNRSKSLLAQLPEKIKACGEMKRNYLAMGSGFYEASAEHGKPPVVPLAIVEALRNTNLLTSKLVDVEKSNGLPTKRGVDIYVNSLACQAIATAVEPLQKQGMTIRPVAIPPSVFGEGVPRTLHAKFLFSANYRDNSNACTSAWVYLGSGNLTRPGFANKMSASTGNLEAGVVFAPNSLYWKENKTTQGHQVVTSLLPIQWDDEIGDATSLSVGSGMEQRDAIYIAPPVAWLTWHEADGVRELRAEEPSGTEFEVLDSAGIACLKTQTGIQWHEVQPRQVRIQWQANEQQIESQIPVVDQYGRIAATQLPTIDIDEAWWQLADFPLPPDEDGGDDGCDENEGNAKSKRRSVPTTSYPIRQMMELVESIAAKQTGIDEMDWVLWCNRLEQTLGQAADSASVKYFRDKLELNPLSPLRHRSFRPSFAENSDSESGKLYDETLVRIEENWNVNELRQIGGAK
jgi:hypothetical protein